MARPPARKCPGMSTLELASTSRAQDAAYLAMADLAEMAAQFGSHYRIVGGHMVTLLVAGSGATGVPERETADADLGVPFSVVRDPHLLDQLRSREYSQAGAANRFERRFGDLRLTIDVLVPSYTGRLETNRPHGDLVLDEIPGLAYALARPARSVTVRVGLTDGSRVTTTVLVPELTAALCIKAIAYRSRFADKDALDLWRLLEAAYAVGNSASTWPTGPTPVIAAEVLRHHFGRPHGTGLRNLTRDRTQRARIRNLVTHLVG